MMWVVFAGRAMVGMGATLSGVSDWFLSFLLERANPTIARGMTLWYSVLFWWVLPAGKRGDVQIEDAMVLRRTIEVVVVIGPCARPVWKIVYWASKRLLPRVLP